MSHRIGWALLSLLGLSMVLMVSCSNEPTGPAGPTAPTGITAAALDSTIELTWQDGQGDIGYRIERGLDGGPMQVVGSVPQDTTRFVDLVASGEYLYITYVVTAFAANGEEAYAGLRHPMGTEGMVWIPGGAFQMGSNGMNQSERPVHTVTVDGFWMDKYEVTNARYCPFLNEQGNQIEGGGIDIEDGDCLIDERDGRFVPKDGYGDHPVIVVSWDGATAYARWAGKRLPTEAEWEYAARAGLVGIRFPWGNEIDHDDANYSGTGGGDQWAKTSPVGSFPPNGYGAYDMAGNAYEWCSDWYDRDYYRVSPELNPTGPEAGTERVLRGGSWGDVPSNLRCAYRTRSRPSATWKYTGLRCVRSSSPGGAGDVVP